MEDERRKEASRRFVIDSILQERDYQLQRWTVDDDRGKTPEEWVSILSIYVGKIAMETPQYQNQNYSEERFRKRVQQLTAIGAALLEAASPPIPEEPNGEDG